MSNHLQKQFEQHPVFQKLKDARASLDQVGSLDLPDEQSRAFVERLNFVLEEVSNRLEVANPYVVRQDVLNNLNSYWNDVNGQLRNYVSNKNAGHLSSANSILDNVVGQLPSLPVPQKGGWLDELGKAARRAKTEVSSHATEVSKAREVAQKALSEAESIQARIAEQKDQFAALQRKLQADYEADAKRRIEDHNKQLQALVRDLGQVKDQQRTDFQAFLDEQKAGAQAEEKSRREAFQAFEKDLEARLQTTQKFLDERRSEVEEVVQATGSASMTGAFQNVGKSAAASASKWRLATAFSLGMLCVLGVLVLGMDLWTDGELKWEQVLARANVTVPFLLFSGYAAAQAHRQHRIEEENKRLSVELSSIDPYLANLPKDVKQSLKATLAPRYFQGIRQELPSEGSQLPTVPGAVQSLAKTK